MRLSIRNDTSKDKTFYTKKMLIKVVCLIALFLAGYHFFCISSNSHINWSTESIPVNVSEEPIRILFINSYDRDSVWTSSIESAFVSTLELKQIKTQYYYEYMSTKKFIGDSYFQELQHLFAEKYKNVPIDYIVTTDDDAALFIAARQKLIFNRTLPVIYCGVNQFYLFPPNFYGVQETNNVTKTISLIRKIQGPQTDILIVTDLTTTSKSIIGSSQVQDIDRMDDHIELLMDNRVDVIRSRLSQKDYDALLYFVFNQDSNGDAYTYSEGFRLFKPYISVPVYSNWNFYFGDGQLGGVITSGESQGQAAANTLFALNSTNVPEERARYKQQILDYPVVINYPVYRSFNFDLTRIPSDAIIINKPQSYFEKNRTIILISTSIILMLLIIISLLTRIIQRKVIELQKSHSDLLEVKNFKNMWHIAVSLSHELNTDIGNSMTLISLMEMKNEHMKIDIDSGALSKKQLIQFIHDVDQITLQLEKNLKKASTYINNIKQKSMVLETASNSDLTDISLLQTLQDTMGRYASTMQDNGIHLFIDCDVNVEFTHYKDLLEEIICILAENSLTHAFPSTPISSFTEWDSSPEIRIIARMKNDMLHIDFTDNGIGMPDSTIDDLFSPMVKGSLSSPGEGMGLFRLKYLIREIFNGDVSYESTSGYGTTFHLYLKKFSFTTDSDTS